MNPFRPLSLGLFLGIATAWVPAFAAPAKASPETAAKSETASKPKEPELSDATLGAIGKIKELSDAGKLDEAIEAATAALPSAPAKTLDRALLCQIQAQLFLQQGKEQKAVAPLEEALAQGVLEEKVAQDFRLYLCQLHFAGERLPQALAWLDQWREKAPAGTVKPEQVLLRGAILYQMNKPAEALVEANNALRLEPKPKDQSWLLLLGSLQQVKDEKACAEYLELVLRENPGDESLWRQLCQIYLSLAHELGKKNSESGMPVTVSSKMANKEAIDSLNFRALLTLERGMERKFFKDPADLETLVTLHYNLEHFTAAASILEKAMADGRLPSTAKQFELLSFCWQLQGENTKAIEVLDRAAVQLKSGDFQFSAAQLLFKEKRVPEAMSRLRLAVADEHLKNPSKAWVFLTYLALEQRDVKTAEEGVAKLKDFPASSKEYHDFGKALEALKKSVSSL